MTRTSVGDGSEKGRSSDKEYGADFGPEGGGSVEGFIGEFPYITALWTGCSGGIAAVPSLLDVVGVVDQQSLAVVDVEFGFENTLAYDNEAAVVVAAGGEGVGGEEGDAENLNDAGGGVVALAVEDAEGHDDAVEVVVDIVVQVATGFVLVLPVNIPVAPLELAAQVIGVELHIAECQCFWVYLQFGFGHFDGAQGEATGEGTEG